MTLLAKYRFALLLSSLLFLLVITPVIHELTFIAVILNFFLSYTLLASILALSQKKTTFRISLVLALPYFVMNWIFGYYPDIPLIERIDLLSGIIFYSYVSFALLLNIFSQQEISLERIFAALSVYLLIGITWSFIYALIESSQPGSFSNIPPELIDPRYRFAYFSFVTLTTLGYGDISPTSNISQAWTILEAIIGQFYLVVVIAGLVGVFISKSIMRTGK